MLEILKNLQIKILGDQKLIINAPFSYLEVLNLDDVVLDTNVCRSQYDFIQIFGKSNHELNQLAHQLIKYLKEDGLLWLCYPKKTSKNYSSDCSKETVEILLEDVHYKSVKQISINEDYSALKFEEQSKI